jgi:integrase
VTGLHPVRKRLKGGDRWYIYAWRGGPRIDVQDGERPVITLDLIRLAEEAREGLRRTATHTVRWLVEIYKSSPQYAKKAKSTKADYDCCLRRIEEEWGDSEIELFEDPRIRSDIDDWRNKWAHQPRTADKNLIMLSTLLNWARRQKGLVSVNIAEGMELLHSVNKSDQIWEDRHWAAINALEDFPPHLMRAVKLASLTGLRLGDLVALTWECDHGQKIDTITMKRGRRAIIPVYAELRSFLDAMKPEGAKGPILLSSRGTPWTDDGLKTVFQRKKPEIFDRTFHDLRGTFVTWLAVKGLTDEQIGRIIGWKLARVAEVRARYVDEARVIVSLVDRLSA